MSFLSGLAQFVKTYSVGVTAAAVSMTFAGYMLLVGGAGDGDPAGEAVVVRHVPVKSPLKQRPESIIAPRRKISGKEGLVIDDMLITSSISRADQKRPVPPPARTAKKPPRNVPARYVLRFATPDVALVEGAGRLWRVEPGDVLPGAGRIIRIERRGRDRWVVKAHDGRRIREISSRNY